MPSRRVVVRKAAAPKKRVVVAPKKKTDEYVPRGVQTKEEQKYDTQIVWSNNEEARRLGIDNTKPAKTVSKVVSIQLSIGNYDRDRTIEELVAEINKQLKPVPYGKDGLHASVMSSYYVVDGKVCQPADYDSEKQNFKDGSLPPAWAGGPMPTKTVKVAEKSTSSSSAAISRKSYDEKYGPEGSPIARQKIADQKERLRLLREGPSDDELEDVDLEWEIDDVEDDEKLEKVAREEQKKAAKTIRVVKKPTPAPKKKVVVRKKAESASKAPVRVIRRKK